MGQLSRESTPADDWLIFFLMEYLEALYHDLINICGQTSYNNCSSQF